MKELIAGYLGFGDKWLSLIALSVFGQLLASMVLLMSGYQDLGLRARMGAAFGFFMSIAFGISALITALRANLLSAVALCALVLCFETWFMLRWRAKTIRNR